MSQDHQLIQERKQKIKLWQELGFEGYAEKYNRTHTSEKAREFIEKNPPRPTPEIMSAPQAQVRMCGRIINLRSMGKLTFLRIRDRDGDFQICLSAQVLGDPYKLFLKALDLGDFCGFEGEFFITKHQEPTLMATQITPLSKTLRPLPEKWHGLSDKESQYRHRYLDLMTSPQTFQRFELRSKVIRMIRDFLERKDFLEIETRTIQPQAGGAMAKVFRTHHEALDSDFVLRIALELDLKMAVGGGMERVFEIGKCFRNEGMDPSHLQEFTMLEWYAAYADLDQNMKWTEEMLREIFETVLPDQKLQLLDKDENPITVNLDGDWERKKFPELLLEYAQLDMFHADLDQITQHAQKWGMDREEIEKTGKANLLDFIYKKSARPHLTQPTFVTDYPSDLKPLARPKEDSTAQCAQLLIGGWEITNAYGELIDPQIQRHLLEKQAQAKAHGDEEAMEVDEVFLRSMEHGFPPMTGFGMGVDRLITLLTQQSNLRDVVLFPLMKKENEKKSL